MFEWFSSRLYILPVGLPVGYRDGPDSRSGYKVLGLMFGGVFVGFWGFSCEIFRILFFLYCWVFRFLFSIVLTKCLQD